MTLKLNAPGGGSVTIDVPTTASNFTLTAPASTGNVVVSPQPVTVPNATGTVMVSGNMPAFSAYASVSTSVSNTTWTKIAFQTEEFDTANCFDSTTNYRFTPNVAGYYQVNGQTTYGITSNSLWALCAIYKNGTAYKYGVNALGSGNGLLVSATSLVYLNGSTDYIELYSYQNSGSSQSSGTANANSSFQASLVRAA